MPGPRCRRIVTHLMIASGTAAAVWLVAASPAPLTAQTPEQRYTDWARPDFRPQEYQYRRGRLLDGLRATGGGLLLTPSSDGTTHGGTFRQLEDFWYLTGLEVPSSMLVLDADQGLSILFMPPRDPRFENPGRPNDFPGRPLLDDYQLRSIAGIDRYRDIAELDAFVRDRVAGGTALRVNAGTAGPVPGQVVPFDRYPRCHRRPHPPTSNRLPRGRDSECVRDGGPAPHDQDAGRNRADAGCRGRDHGRDPRGRQPDSCRCGRAHAAGRVRGDLPDLRLAVDPVHADREIRAQQPVAVARPRGPLRPPQPGAAGRRPGDFRRGVRSQWLCERYSGGRFRSTEPSPRCSARSSWSAHAPPRRSSRQSGRV